MGVAERRKMKHTINYNEKDKVVELKVVGDVTPDEAQQMIKEVGKTLDEKGNRHFLLDFTESPRLQMDKDARKIIGAGAKNLDLERIAITGTTPMNRMMAKVVLALLGKGKITKFFDTKEVAISWLKGLS